MVFWRRKKKQPEASRKLEVEETDDFDVPEYESHWEMGDSDSQLISSLVSEMQRTGAIDRKKPKPVQEPNKRQSVQDIGSMLQETADGLDEQDDKDNNYYDDAEAESDMLARQGEIGDAEFANPIFDGDDDEDPYRFDDPQNISRDDMDMDNEDFYRYGPGGATHGRMI